MELTVARPNNLVLGTKLNGAPKVTGQNCLSLGKAIHLEVRRLDDHLHRVAPKVDRGGSAVPSGGGFSIQKSLPGGGPELGDAVGLEAG